jgi:hypothetical protein
MSFVVANNEDANRIVYNPEEKMERKSRKVSASNIPRSDPERFRTLRRLFNNESKLPIELVGQGSGRHVFVVLHDPGDVSINFGMENDPHQLRRR